MATNTSMQLTDRPFPQSLTGLRLARRHVFGNNAPLLQRNLHTPRSRCFGAVQARRRQQLEKDDDDEGVKGLPNLLSLVGGSRKVKAGKDPLEGTQRIKTRKPQPAKGTQVLKNKLQPPSTGTQRLKLGTGTQRLKVGGGGGPGNFLSRLSTQTTRIRRKDPNMIFVAGATGRLGARIVRELLNAGFRVRAGARNVEKAREFVRAATALGVLTPAGASKLEIVQVDITEEDSILEAIGNAGKVVQAIGAAESEVLNFGAPKKIDGDGAINLVNAAVQAQVEQFVMVTSLGTGKWGWPAGALNLFGGVLIQKRRAEKALEDSGLPYVIVRPGGMERPTDDYKKTHNVRLATRDQLFGGQVSRLQVAELVSAAVASPDLAENKVLEVVAEQEYELQSYEALLQAHPSEVSQAEREAQLEAVEQARARLGDAQQQVEDAAEAKQEAEGLVQQLQEALQAKRQAIAQVEKEVGPIVKEAQSVEAELARLRDEAESSKRREEAAKAVLSAASAAAREGRVLSPQEIDAIERPILNPAAPPAQQASQQAGDVAEGISKKSNGLKLGRFAPRLSKQEQEKEQDEPTTAKPGKKEVLSRAAPPKQEQDGVVKAAAAPAPPKPKMTAEDVERLQQARTQAAQSRAQKEAEVLARIEAEREEELAKQRQAAAKKAEDARKKVAEARKATQAKLEAALKVKDDEEAKAKEAEDKKAAEAKTKAEAKARSEADAAAKAKAESEAKAQHEAEAKAKSEAKAQEEADKKAAAEAESKTDVEAKAQEEAEAKAVSSSQKEAAEQAKNNAQEARKWIDEWRAGSKASASGRPAVKEAVKETAMEVIPEADKAVQAAALEAKKNAKEARDWIDAWRKGDTAPESSAGKEGNGAGIFSGFGGFKFPWQQNGNGAAPEQSKKTASTETASPKAEAAEPPQPAASPQKEGVSPNVREAREWIRNWRAGTLESKLPENANASTK